MSKPGILHVGKCLFLACACLLTAPLLLSGCGHVGDAKKAGVIFSEANDLFHQGSYEVSLGKYSEIIEKYPEMADRALFEMGTLYAYAGNDRKDYGKSLECFRKLVRDHPGSAYRRDSEMMIFNLENVAAKDKTIAAQQRMIDTLRNEVRGKDNEVVARQEKIEALERKFVAYSMRGPVDRILIEKGARRLTLISRGEAIRSYKIALGGNPVGPKERQGDNKTPEGIYTIEGRNKDSQFHLSLRISYPNENDRKRAKQLGVDPGGDIMIHGIKNEFAYVGEAHAGVDWTKGCIAVTDEEIEEIARVAPDGTIVEIRP